MKPVFQVVVDKKNKLVSLDIIVGLHVINTHLYYLAFAGGLLVYSSSDFVPIGVN